MRQIWVWCRWHLFCILQFAKLNRAVSAYTGSHHQVLVVVKAHLENKLLHEFLLLLLTLVAMGKAYTLANSKTAWQ